MPGPQAVTFDTSTGNWVTSSVPLSQTVFGTTNNIFTSPLGSGQPHIYDEDGDISPEYDEGDEDPDDLETEFPGDSESLPPEPAYEPPSTGFQPQYGLKKFKMSNTKSKEVFYNRKLKDWHGGFRAVEGEVGLEIECEGLNLFDSPINYWQAVSDGSLRVREGHPPVEYRLKKPLSRKDVTKALTYLSKQLKASSSTVLDSSRTSVHVHLNCQEMTVKEIFTFICLYLFFENALVEWCGPQRVGNLFCMRAKDAEYWVYSIVQAFQSKSFENVFSDNFRYTSCNTASLAKFGSLEFRPMRGTVDQDTIQLWVDILLYLKDESLKFDNPADLYENYFSLGPLDFFKSIFYNQTRMYDTLVGTRDLVKGIMEGAVFVRDIAQAVDPWKKPLPKPDKEEPEEIQEEAAPVSQNRVTRFAYAKDQSHCQIVNSSSTQEITKRHPITQSLLDIPPRRVALWDHHGWIAITDFQYVVRSWLTE